MIPVKMVFVRFLGAKHKYIHLYSSETLIAQKEKENDNNQNKKSIKTSTS